MWSSSSPHVTVITSWNEQQKHKNFSFYQYLMHESFTMIRNLYQQIYTADELLVLFVLIRFDIDSNKHEH